MILWPVNLDDWRVIGGLRLRGRNRGNTSRSVNCVRCTVLVKRTTTKEGTLPSYPFRTAADGCFGDRYFLAQ
jgi:hypothetical protein